MSAERVDPYRMAFPESDLADLRRRLAETRWPEPETVADWSQGVPSAYLADLVAYWATDYDWSTTQARLNRLPQYTTVIDHLPLHFFEVRSPDPAAVPVILTHGWPGSFFEFEAALEPLVTGSPPFHVVVPSLPGFGLSGRPTTTGWDIHRIADAWVELMGRLGHRRFLAMGSDWGTSISTSIAMRHPDRLLGLHLVPPLVAPTPGEERTEWEQTALAELADRTGSGSGYSAIQSTRPQTVGYGLVDSPVGLAAWLLDKIWSWVDHDGDLTAVLSRDQILDNITLYWLTRTAASSARLYWESIAEVSRFFTEPVSTPVDVPIGATVFPREVPRPSRRWAEQRFTRIVHWGEPARGGHFGAWEQPAIFVDELRSVAGALA
jgi:pimeloyl-ACP methyl ester carboxylesterase